MGFDVTGSVARLQFGEGTLLDGATVRVSLDMSLREMLTFQRSINALDENAREQDIETVYRGFAENYLVSWDLERKGEPISADIEGFYSLPFRTALEILKAWMQAIGGVSPNSNAVSANGDTSEAESEVTEAA